jgi:hypothetical protein
MQKIIIIILLLFPFMVISQTNSLVTELYLANNFTPKSGVTPGSNNTLFMDCDQILARYNVVISGTTSTGERLPSQNQITGIYNFYIVSANTIWGVNIYDLVVSDFYTSYSSQFTDISKGSDWIVAIKSDGSSFKIEDGICSSLGNIGSGYWISVEYVASYDYFMAVNTDGNVAVIYEGSGGEWGVAADLSSSATNYKIVVNGTDCFIGTMWGISKCSSGAFSTWTTLTSFSQDYYLRNRSFTVSDNSSYILIAFGKYVNSNDYSIEGAHILSSGSVSPFFATTPNKLSYSSFAEYLAGNGVIARAVFSQESGSSPVFYIDSNGWYTESVLVDAAEYGSNIVGVGNGCVYISVDGGSTLEDAIVSGGAYNFQAICAGY